MERILDFLFNFYGTTHYLVVFGVLLACGLGVPIPEDITLFIGGALAYYGTCNIYVMIVVCFAGVMIGDSIVYYLGFKYGREIAKRGVFKKLLHPERLDAIAERFRQKGTKLLFAARFMPGLRAPIFFSAGVLHVPFRTFLFYDGGAALLSVPAIVGLVYYFGDQMDTTIRYIQKSERGILIVIALVILGVGIKWYLNKRKAARPGTP